MNLEHLDAFEVCYHRKLSVDFKPGNNGIVGPNGSGKSSILKIVQWLITGDFTTNAGVKESNICTLAPEGAKSYGVLNMTHAGDRLEIVRGLQKCKTQMTVNGGKPLFGETEVSAEIGRILGADMRLISDNCFIGQGRLYDFIDQTPAVRLQSFQSMFGTKAAELVAKAIADWLPSIEIGDPDVEIRTIEGSLAENEASARKAGSSLKRYRDVEGYDVEADPLQTLIKQQESYDRIQADADQLLRDIAAQEKKVQELEEDTSAADEVDQLRTKIRAIDNEITATEQGLAESQADVDDARAVLKNFSAYQRAAEAKEKVAKRLKELQAQLKTLREAGDPERPKNYVPEEERDSYTETLDREYASTRYISDLVNQYVRVRNPTGLLAKIYEIADSADDRVEELVFKLGTAEQVLAKSRKHDQAFAERHRALAELQRDFHRTKDQLEETVVPAAPKGDKETLEELVSTYEELTETLAQKKEDHSDVFLEIQEAEKDVQTHDKDVTAAKATLKSLKDRRHKLLAGQPKAVDPKKLTEAREKIEEKKKRLLERSGLEGEITSLDKTRKTLTARLESAKVRAENGNALIRLKRDISSVREVMLELPKIVAADYLSMIAEDTNDLLHRIDANFRIGQADGLTFAARFLDGREQVADRISGGQKVLLGILVRVARITLFTQDLGLLTLDEPTQFLDEENVLALAPTVERLRELSASTGLQCLIVTHEPRLSAMFDHMIDLHPVARIKEERRRRRKVDVD